MGDKDRSASPGEGVKLIQAFHQITDPERRAEVIALAERYAEEAVRALAEKTRT
jgi:hypothetical protein